MFRKKLDPAFIKSECMAKGFNVIACIGLGEHFALEYPY
jgi:hypothetical protein